MLCVLSIETSILRSKLFHFKSFWPAHLGFLELVKLSWLAPIKASSSATLILAKLKRLRYALKKWSKSISKRSLLIENSNRVGVSSEIVLDFNLSDIIQSVPGLEVLSTPFSKEEIDHVIKIIPADPAVGLDGLCVSSSKFVGTS